MAAPAAALVEAGGRKFRVVNMEVRTVDLHHHQRAIINQSGVGKILPAPDELPDHWAIRLHSTLTDSGLACDVLAGYLIPADKTERDWTPAMAADTTAFLKQLNTENDRQLVDQLAMEFVLGFFQRAISLLQTSLKYLEQASGRAETGIAAP